MAETARRIVLARRPQGAPVPEDFRLEEAPPPEPGPGEALVRTIWLSLDPYMRGRISEGPSYAKGVAPGEAMPGEAVGQVLASRSPDLAEGDFVRRPWRLADPFRPAGRQATQLDPAGGAAVDGAGHPRHAGHDRLYRPDGDRPAPGRRDPGDRGGLGCGGRHRRPDRQAQGAARGRHRRRRPRNAATSRASSASTSASTAGSPISRAGCRPPARRVSTSISSSPRASPCGPPCP